MRSTHTIACVVAALATASASADIINPAQLITSPDGPNANLQQLIYDANFTSSVGSLESPGDQTDDEWFKMCRGAESMHWEVSWQRAGHAPHHKLGYFMPETPDDITWVIGGSSSGLPSAAELSISGLFALAFYSGDNRGVNSTIYRSVTSMNPDGKDHMVSLTIRDENGTLRSCGRILSWEDLWNLGDKDYNDFGVVAMTGMVPTPGALAALGLAGAIAGRRRR
jgi:MYXO-CTERM domain-containing protein